MRQKLIKIKQIFTENGDFEGVEESRDSTDKKMIFLVPIQYVSKLSTLIKQIEDDYPEFQIDIELNRLEDSYVKIAEDEVKLNENQRLDAQDQNKLMSQEEMQHEIEAYRDRVGK